LTWLEMLAGDKHSSLLRIFVNYGQKYFITMATGANVTKLFMAVSYKLSQ
jgi:hypothetical protein